MGFYFRLQYTLLKRHIVDFGLPPWAGGVLSVTFFLGLSFYLFARVDYAAYVYSAIAMGLLLNFSDENRNGFLKSCFNKEQFLKIRLLENALIALPFVAFLGFKLCFWEAAVLILFSSGSVLLSFRQTFSFTLPTPFYKLPFEFIIGFRRYFLLIFFAWFLVLMSVLVDNFNLGIFGLLLVFLISLAFYSTPESRFFVWIFMQSPKQFLHQKLKTALLHSSMISLPLVACLMWFYGEQWWIILAVQGLGYLYLSCMVLAKYLNFPDEINLPQSFIIGLGLWFPPLLLGIIPFFYSKSVKKLKEVLE